MHTKIADLAGCNVTQYPYRTACLRGDAIQRSSYTVHDEAARVEEALAQAAGVHKDNHTVYKVELPTGETRYVMFSDWRVAETGNPTAFVEGRW